MNDSGNFIFRYKQLKNQRPSIVASGFWFIFVWFIARVFFFFAFAGLIITFLWALEILPIDKKVDWLSNTLGLKTFLAFLFFFILITSGFAARMAKRVVVRNGYIAQLELLVEEELKKG